MTEIFFLSFLTFLGLGYSVNKSLKLVNDDAEEFKPMVNLLIGYLMALGVNACFSNPSVFSIN